MFSDWSNVASALEREIHYAEKPVIVLDRSSNHRVLAGSLSCKRQPVEYIRPADACILAACHKKHGTLVCIDGDQNDAAFMDFMRVFLPVKIICVCGSTNPHIITGGMRTRVCLTDPGDGRLLVLELDNNSTFCIGAETPRHVYDKYPLR